MSAGLAELDLAPAMTVVRPVRPVPPRVNLLPPEILERRRFRRVQWALGGAVLTSIVAVTVVYVSSLASVAAAGAELDAAAADGARLRSQASTYADVNPVYAKADQARALLSTAMGQEVRWSFQLDALGRTVPPNVWVRKVVFTQTPPAVTPGSTVTGGIGTATFAGSAFDQDEVAAWLDAVGAQPGYADPVLLDSTETLVSGRKVVTFTSSVTVTPEALSGRFATPAPAPAGG